MGYLDSTGLAYYDGKIKDYVDARSAAGSTIVTVSGTDPVITAVDNTRYVCGEVTSLSFTPCASGICDVIFTSGSTVAVLTLPSTVKMPDGFEVEANCTYEINILDGVWGVYQKWVN